MVANDFCTDANDRAEELLHRILSEQEWKQFRKKGVLEVVGSRGTYCISANYLTDVINSGTRRRVATACLQFSAPAPALDRVVAEYVLIRNDEDLYWRTANIYPPAPSNWILATLIGSLDLVLLAALILQLSK